MAAQRYRTRRVDVPREPLLAERDYADAFELQHDGPDQHTAEEWVRQGLEGSPAPMRGLIRFVHAHLLRFDLSDEPGSVLGWRVLLSEPDVVHLQAQGGLARADIVARRTPTTAGVATSLSYRHAAAPVLWWAIGPLHRAIAPYLLRRAAVSLLPSAGLSAGRRSAPGRRARRHPVGRRAGS
jgi:hypothetical protein